ncbi:MAG: glycine cleavage system aminomethyltransferase GcvT [Clostridium sp.]|nr:glycine cleavage system aminomethyltransferase GcvT [Clostridium sp.]
MINLKRTPLAGEYEKYGGKTVDFAGWYMPVEFEGIMKEHEEVRERVGLFDVSHMGEILVDGKDALNFVNFLVTNDVETLVDHQVQYAFFCYENGGVVDDLIIYRYHEEKFLLVVNASNVEKDYLWILKHMAGYDVQVKNISNETAQLAVQGKKAQALLQTLTSIDLEEIKFFHFREDVEIAGIKTLISRTGYTGEDGFELYMKNEEIKDLYHKIIEAGAKPIGLGARDTLRFEANLPLYGNELSDEWTPLEAGYGFFVKMNKKEFIGKDALKLLKEQGLKRKIVGFVMEGKKIPRHGYRVYKEEEDIGFVTTGYKSPTLGEYIGLAMVNIEHSSTGEEIFIEIRGKKEKAQVRNRKFLSKP